MKYFRINKDITILKLLFLLAGVVFVVLSCNPTKYVPKDESLLDENHIVINNDSIKKGDILPLIKQKPNKRIFGVRFHLGLYDLSNISKEKWPHGWLRNIGEEPVIYDSYATGKTIDQINSYLISKGYFDGKATETVMTANRKSEVYYNIEVKPAYTVRNLYYEIADSGLINIIEFDSVNCLIEKGRPYDADILQAERTRLERSIRDMGFYYFSGENIYFRIDSTVGNRQVDIYYGVKKMQKYDATSNLTYIPNEQYTIRKIYIYPDYIPREVLAGGETYQRSMDTIEYKGYYFISNLKKQTIKYDVIIQALYLKPGATFNVSNSERSQAHLMSFRTYRLVNIRYNETEKTQPLRDDIKGLDCFIQLTPMSPQSFSVELEGTNSGGNLGGALNFIYANKNLFHGAEQFSFKVKGAYETFSRSSNGLTSSQEFGADAALRLPRFLFPFLARESFVKNYNPITTIQTAYNYQNLPVYTRTVANASFGYLWKHGEFITHMVNPLQLSMVKIPFIDSVYNADVIQKSTYLMNSYKDMLIAGGTYSFIYNNQKLKRARDSWFVRFNFEAAGNLPYALKKVFRSDLNIDTASGHEYYNLLGQPFAQYLRSDIDIRYHRIINDFSSIVYRGFFGIGIPYKNSLAMPFEKQYFEGGANGIRGWQVRSLGPGSYYPPSSTYVNQTGDIKLEANIEYRFKLFWVLEGTAFVDAGNIWAIKEDVDRPGAQFKLNSFYKETAVGSGFGLRWDLKFVLLRTDLGFKIRDPKDPEGQQWIFSQQNLFDRNNMVLVISIGYPF